MNRMRIPNLGFPIEENNWLDNLEKALSSMGYKKACNYANSYEDYCFVKEYENYVIAILLYDFENYADNAGYGISYRCDLLCQKQFYFTTTSITLDEFLVMAEKFYCSMRGFI